MCDAGKLTTGVDQEDCHRVLQLERVYHAYQPVPLYFRRIEMNILRRGNKIKKESTVYLRCFCIVSESDLVNFGLSSPTLSYKSCQVRRRIR